MNPDEPAPNIQFLFGPGYDPISLEVIDIGIAVTHLHPKSRDQVTLRSSNPEDAPLIKINYLTHPGDLARLREGEKTAQSMCRANALAKYRRGERTLTPEEIGDAEIEIFIRGNGKGIWHPVGTCKMGRDPLAVVGPQLRVHGLKGLRVADASIMPQVTSGNTNAPAIMIGEKAADLVLRSRTLLSF